MDNHIKAQLTTATSAACVLGVLQKMKMTFEKWQMLSEEEMDSRCQDLNPYEEWDVFKAIESVFLDTFKEQKGIEKAHCGLGSGMGPFNSIVVTIKKGEKRTQLPKKFMGFPITKEYQKSKVEPGRAHNVGKRSPLS